MKILHTMIRVGDLPRSIDFYTGVLGMKLLRETDRPEQKYRLAFVGFANDPGRRGDRAHLQLRRGPLRARQRVRPHRGRGARCRRACDPCAERRQGHARGRPVKGGSTVIAFVEDPDGYKIELIERA
jgi:lactoylglutathione lyase